jgi:hypothetical protein
MNRLSACQDDVVQLSGEIVELSKKHLPLIIFIIICFFTTIGFIMYRFIRLSQQRGALNVCPDDFDPTDIRCNISRPGLPTISDLSLLCFFMTMSCSILTVVGVLSVSAEWSSMIVFVLVIILTIISFAEPTIFFYSPIS